mgnify:CR=1 FL=1
MIRLVSIIKRRRRRGQAAVETMLLVFLVMLVLLGLVHFFSLTWGSQNAHLRAREAAFHGDAFLQGTRAGSQFTQPGTAPFSTSLAGPGGNYTVAPSEVLPFVFSAGASDEPRDDMFRQSGQTIRVDAVIMGN